MDHEAICDAVPGQQAQMMANRLEMQDFQQQEQAPVNPETLGMITRPLCLAMPTDKDWLTPLHCFVRRHCVEVFTAGPDDVAHPAKGKRKPIQVGQVGIRCPFCHVTGDSNNRERGSVYYPTTVGSIYNATMNLLQRHLHSCPAVPDQIMEQYHTLKGDDARSGTSKKYWMESAQSLGLVDTPAGIRYSNLPPPPLPHLSDQQQSTSGKNDMFSSKSNAAADSPPKDGEEAADKSQSKSSPPEPLVQPEDKPYATRFSYELLNQMQPCVFTEADRLGKRKGLPAGFAGLACKHCFGGYGSGRFFPSSIKTLSDTSKTLNVLHNHMMKCRKCPGKYEIRSRSTVFIMTTSVPRRSLVVKRHSSLVSGLASMEAAVLPSRLVRRERCSKVALPRLHQDRRRSKSKCSAEVDSPSRLREWEVLMCCRCRQRLRLLKGRRQSAERSKQQKEAFVGREFMFGSYMFTSVFEVR